MGCCSGGRLPQGHEDDFAQRAVLVVLLDAHPGQLSAAELTRELADGPEWFTDRDRVADPPDRFAYRDRIETAMRELVGAGLAHRHGDFLFATRAAARFDELGL